MRGSAVKTSFEFTGHPRRIVILDNRDSFVFNIAHRLFEVGFESEVVRSDHISVSELLAAMPRALIVSPGPGGPAEAGISVEAIQAMSMTTPILGICLGHQAIALAFGGRVSVSGKPCHGKASEIEHSGSRLFKGLPNPVSFGRYHSLIVEDPLPEDFEVTARSLDGLVMAMQHRSLPVFGVQFHPESILSEYGKPLLENFCLEAGLARDIFEH